MDLQLNFQAENETENATENAARKAAKKVAKNCPTRIEEPFLEIVFKKAKRHFAMKKLTLEPYKMILLIEVLPIAAAIAAALGLVSIVVERQLNKIKMKRDKLKYDNYRAEMRKAHAGRTLMFRSHAGVGYTYLVTLDRQRGQQSVELLDKSRL